MNLRLENSTKVAIIDDVDAEKVIHIKWYLNKNTGYVYGYFGNNKKRLLHRFLLDLPPRIPFVDHKDNNSLNCQRSNLRTCTNQQNTCNQGKTRGGTSRFKGVSWEKRVCKWRATIFANMKQYHIGTFESEEDAARAYDSKAKELHGEFACLNFKE